MRLGLAEARAEARARAVARGVQRELRLGLCCRAARTRQGPKSGPQQLMLGSRLMLGLRLRRLRLRLRLRAEG